MQKRGTLWMAALLALLALLALAALAPDAALAEEVPVPINATNFPDETFRDYVEQFDTSGDGSLSDTEIATVTRINVSSQGITNLTGIEHFTALTYLNCSYNNLTALVVSGCTELETLDCSNNQLTQLDVSECTVLETLYCSTNNLTSLDVSQNTALEKLYCPTNNLTSLDVSQNTELDTLYCSENNLESLNVLGCTELNILDCSSNQLTALNVSSNTELTDLYCSSNRLTALDVSGYTNLQTLNCSNQVAELNVDRANDNWSVNLSEKIGGSWDSVTDIQTDPESVLSDDKTTVSWNRGRVEVSYQYKTGYQETLMDVTLTLIPKGASDDTSVSKVTVGGTERSITIDGENITVKLPAEIDPSTVDGKITITPTDPAAVASTPTTTDSGTTWTFTVTAEDGQTTQTYTLFVLPAYTVTVTSGDHGTASASPELACESELVTLTATPNDGYVFDRWEVTEGGVTIENNTFAMPANNVAITAKWAENAPPYVPPTPVAPPEIDFTPGGDQPGGDEPGGDQPASVELEPGQSATLDLGVVDNYAAFAAAGVEIVATPVCDAGMTASAAIDQSGRILLNLYAIEPGEHQVSVTLSAAGCQPVTVAQITLTVPEAQPEDPEDPDAPDLPDIQPQEGTQAYTGVQGVTHLSLSQGTVVFTLPDLAGTEGVVWKSSKPKVVSIDPQTGEAQLKKSGTATLTATLPDGTTITQKVNVHKKDFAQPDTIRLQTKVDGKWTDVPEEGIVVVPKKSGQKSVPTRLVGDGGEIIIESIEADKALLTRSSGNPAPVKIKKRSLTDGQTTALIIKANGQEFTLPITIDSTAKDLYPDPLPSEIQSILQQEE